MSQIENQKNARKLKKKDSATNFLSNLTDSDKQRFATFLAYIVVFAVAVLSSYLSVAFGTGENFKPAVFITNLCFNIVIGVIGLMLSLKDGRLSNENRRKGDLFEVKQEFKKASNRIVDVDAFRQWNDQNYEKERHEYIMDQLSKINIFDPEYLNVTDSDLELLMTQPAECVVKKDGKETIVQLDQIDEYQKDMIKFYRSGKFKFKKIPYSFFRSFKGRNDYKYYADTEGSDKKIELMAYAYRITMIVIFSIIISFTLVNPTNANGKQVIYDVVTRVSNAVLSIFMGYNLAHDEMDRLIDSLSFKIDKIESYITDIDTGKFVPLSRSEAIALKIKEIREKRELENKSIDMLNNTIENETSEKPPVNKQETKVQEIEMTEAEYQKFIVEHPESIITE